MPSAARRRRTVQEDESEEDEERSQTQGTQRNRRRAPPSEDDSEEEVQEEDEEMPDADADAEPNSQDQLVKKLVRYALACEYQRLPIRRNGITEKVIGKQRGNNFKQIFAAAQDQLRIKFGMEMLELPGKEKVTMKEKRAALKTKGGSKSTTSWILTTILPPEYRIAEIMPPSIIGSEEEEAAYMGICSVIVSLISLSSGGELPDHKLMNYLERFNSGKNTGIDTTAATLARMIKHGYIYKSVEKSADDETTHWRVGPRGKVEIGNSGIQGLVREVYEESAPDDLEKRMQRSLGMEVRKVPNKSNGNGVEEDADGEAPENEEPEQSTARRANGRRRG